MSEPRQARSIATLEKIMVAAEAVVAREGVASLTMDGVAQEAGISKGGVLYHFRSKESLIARLASRRLHVLRDEMERESARQDGTSNKSLGGIIGHASMTYGRDDGFSRAMLTAAVENSQSLDQFKALFADNRIRARPAGECRARCGGGPAVRGDRHAGVANPGFRGTRPGAGRSRVRGPSRDGLRASRRLREAWG